ncbi:hypothetical protein Poly51_04290 [Rubripirellula tenax]|uniref:Uncharacterized protein n=1 Tax=Rubripirellula tenax TaxID=2528015 RepID=A0A5C6FK63_9BACT|nr:hypothetical protein Poly51_04290 [Rubripirellula tenax]
MIGEGVAIIVIIPVCINAMVSHGGPGHDRDWSEKEFGRRMTFSSETANNQQTHPSGTGDVQECADPESSRWTPSSGGVPSVDWFTSRGGAIHIFSHLGIPLKRPMTFSV